MQTPTVDLRDNLVSLVADGERNSYYIINDLKTLDELTSSFPRLKNRDTLPRIGDLYNFGNAGNIDECKIYAPEDMDIDFNKLPIVDIDKLARCGIKIEISQGYPKFIHEDVVSLKDIDYEIDKIKNELKDIYLHAAELEDALDDLKVQKLTAIAIEIEDAELEQ